MAVIQISRIQHRRGQKNTGSGLPQLASGELGWSIDTQELFIGNGAVSEGAPAVGNTKILTEKDNIFTLANAYSYRNDDGYISTGSDASSPIFRSLQERLDDRVSVRAFGAKGDGIADDTASLQRSIDQLYLNEATRSSEQSRIVLHLEAGMYIISEPLHLPPHANIVGAGSDKTFIKQTANSSIFVTVNASSEPGSPANDSSSTLLNQARSISVQGITLEQENPNAALQINSCRDSLFRDIKCVGTWSAGDALAAEDCSVNLQSLSGAVSSSNNRFENCVFTKSSYGVISDSDIENNRFESCDFQDLGYGMALGTGASLVNQGNQGSVLTTTINNSKFININRQGIWIKTGKYNLSSNNRFELVGTNHGSEVNPVYPIIQYDQQTNKSQNDYFARTEALTSGSSIASVPYIPEVEGTAIYENIYETSVNFGRLNNIRLFRLPGVQNHSYEIDYTIISRSYRVIRSGVMTVIVEGGQNNVGLSDSYDFIGDNDFLDDIEFSAQLRDADSDGTPETIVIRVTSTMPNDDESVITFTTRAKKTDTPPF